MSNVIWTKRNSWPLCDGPDVAGAFRPIKVVGEGAFGVVLLVRKVLGPGRGSTHAMKIMHKEAVDRRVLVAEREILGKVCGIDSRFLVRLQYAFQSRDKVFLVMEYSGGGGLVDHVARCGGKLRKDASRRLAAQLASGLRDLHAHSIIHRDLKPENVLLHDDGFVKIADFGLSTLCPTTVQRGGPAARKAGFAGTVEYAAPERLQKTGSVTTAAVDWWAFGAILFECVCGRTPFGAATARDLFINVLFRDPAFENAFDDDPFARDLLDDLAAARLHEPLVQLARHDALAATDGGAEAVECGPAPRIFAGAALRRRLRHDRTGLGLRRRCHGTRRSHPRAASELIVPRCSLPRRNAEF